MAPKAQTTTRRGRAGKAAATQSVAPVAPASPSKKRGRPSKVNGIVESPKKRGRPAKVQTDEPIAQIDKAIKRGRRSVAAAEEVVAEAPVPTKKRAGRPAKAATETVAAAAEVAAPKKRAGRPPKDAAPATPKRGRPALDLNKVAGPARVAKRSSPRSKPAAKAAPKVAAAPRINPKMRSRLRDRTASTAKPAKEVAQPPKKGRGRPKKVEAKTEATAPKKTAGRGRKAVAPTPAVATKKVTARPKTAAPRKRRGYTALEVPDKFAAQVKQYLVELQAEDAANTAAAAGEADDEGDEGDAINVDAVIDLGSEEEDIAGPSNGVVTDLDEGEAAGELTEEEQEDEDGDMPIDAADGADVAQLDEENDLAREADDAGVPQSSDMDDELDDDTELPSETAVLAEIAAVQGNDNMDIDDLVEVEQTELQRRLSSSDLSVDLERDITEVTSRPQMDGTTNIDIYSTHIDQHEHIHEPAHVPDAAPSTNLGTLFGGF